MLGLETEHASFLVLCIPFQVQGLFLLLVCQMYVPWCSRARGNSQTAKLTGASSVTDATSATVLRVIPNCASKYDSMTLGLLSTGKFQKLDLLGLYLNRPCGAWSQISQRGITAELLAVI